MALVSKNFSDIITFTRASTGTFFNSAGVLTSAAIDAPRLDYDPSTLAALGFLVEESRTNSIRNNTMVGAVAGTPGTLPTNWQRFTSGTAATAVVGTGTESGITYFDITFSGGNTDSISFFMDGTTGHAALNGQTWTGSAYYKLTAGSFANCTALQAVYEANAAGTALANSTTSITTVTGAALSSQRITTTRVNNNASTAEEQLTLQITGTGAFSFTLRIGLPQLELGAFATSVIPTTTTALTRAADVASVNTLSPWFNSTTGTLFTESQQLPGQTAAVFPRIAVIDDGSTNNAILNLWRSDTSRLYGSITFGGANQADVGTNGVTQTNVNKIGLAYATNDFAASVNGGAPSTDTLGSVPSGLTTLRIGRSSGTDYLNGYLRRITYYPRALSAAELQAITT
jgi:hypothetical protein